MNGITLGGAILILWAIGVPIDIFLRRRAALRAMSDDALIVAMNGPGHFDNKFRREYARRHPMGALPQPVAELDEEPALNS
jgi:hypothetical protein